MNEELSSKQESICKKYGVVPYPAPSNLKVGISPNVKEGLQPLNGMRCKPEGDTTGWYIWAGEELSTSPDFFVPLHVEHLQQWCPAILPYLSLPPGWRFLIAAGHEDVWYDEGLVGS